MFLEFNDLTNANGEIGIEPYICFTCEQICFLRCTGCSGCMGCSVSCRSNCDGTATIK